LRHPAGRSDGMNARLHPCPQSPGGHRHPNAVLTRPSAIFARRISAIMPIKTKRWNDPREADDGWRILICRYRPRALPKKDETWDAWYKELGPSRELHARYYGKPGYSKVSWEAYRALYLQETQEQAEAIDALA